MRPVRTVRMAMGAAALCLGAPMVAAPSIDPKYLSITDCPSQPGCPALMLLAESEFNNDSSRTKYTIHRMVKVFTQEGVDRHADVETPTSVGGYESRNLKGRTILPDGQEVPLTQENIFVKYLRQGKRYMKTRTAKFPGVVPGAIIDYSFEVVTEQHTLLSQFEWYIQHDIPVLENRFTLKPGKYEFGWKKAGVEPVTVRQESPFKNATHYLVNDVPAIPDEPFGPPADALRFRYWFNLPELQQSWLGDFLGRVSGWTGAYITDAPGVAEKVASLVAPSDPPIEKVRKIYRFVQEKIGTEEMRAQKTGTEEVKEAANAGEVLAHGFGNEFERSMLFMAMVRAAGLEHGVLLIAGRFSSALNVDVPDEDQFDSYAIAVKIGAGWNIFDPATRHCPFGFVSAEKEGGQSQNAVLVKPIKGAGAPRDAVVQNLRVKAHEPASYGFFTVPFSAAAKNVLKRDVEATLLPDGSLEAKVAEQGTGLIDLDHQQDYELLDEAQRRDKLRSVLERSFATMELTSAEFEAVGSFDKPAVIKYTVRLSGEAEQGDRMLLVPSFFHAGEDIPFTAATRRSDVFFPHAMRTQERIRIALPAGYEVQELPVPVVVKDPPLSLAIGYSTDAGALTLTRNLDIDTARWPAADYPRLKAFFEKVREADRRTVILAKAAP